MGNIESPEPSKRRTMCALPPAHRAAGEFGGLPLQPCKCNWNRSNFTPTFLSYIYDANLQKGFLAVTADGLQRLEYRRTASNFRKHGG